MPDIRPGFAADGAAASQDAVIARHGFSAGELGYVLIDLDQGKTVDHWQADQVFVPGSVLKLATSLVAWQVLGGDFHFSTKLWRKDAALYLQGSGDPTLTINDLQSLAQQWQAGKAAVPQTFFVDGSAVLSAPDISKQQPIAADYNPGYGALNVDFNRIAVQWDIGPGGKPDHRLASIADGLSLPVDWLPLTPVTTDLPPAAPFLLASPGGDQEAESWSYDADLSRAGLGKSAGYFLPVKNADPMAARLFRAIALRQGINLPLPQPRAVPPDAVPVASHDSPPLSEMLRALLKFSNNLSGEMIGLTSARQITKHPTTLPTAAEANMTWLQTHLPQIDWQGFRMVNHSGLDGDNRATPRQIAAILQAMAGDPALAACLPPLSISDDADAVLPATVKLTGKSGTMDYAAGLAGLITSANGHRFAYAIFVTDAAQRARLAAAFDPRILHAASDGHAWTKRARALEMDLLRAWLAKTIR